MNNYVTALLNDNKKCILDIIEITEIPHISILLGNNETEEDYFKRNKKEFQKLINEIYNIQNNQNKISIELIYKSEKSINQLYNAKVLEKVGAAKIILNNDLTGELLNNELKNIINNPQLMRDMGTNASKIEAKDVENKIYEEIKKLVK